MASKLITTNEMEGMRVLGGKGGSKRIGKVRRVVFHPTEKRVVGFVVKRPDLLWMFHRKDWFVSISGFDLEDGRMVVHDTPEARDKGACDDLGVDYDQCVLWIGLPVMTQDGQSFGVVDNVTFNLNTGAVDSFTTSGGATANALLGRYTIPAEDIKGFRRGMGTALKVADTWEDGQEPELGAIMVSTDVKSMGTEGGVAEVAGKATAVAVDKVQNTVEKAKEKAKPVVSDAAKKTGEMVNKGAYATGAQLAKSKTMFSDFKSEYDKAVAPTKKPAAKKATTSGAKKPAAKKAAAKKQPPKKNMFAAFKDEYDKAKRG